MVHSQTAAAEGGVSVKLNFSFRHVAFIERFETPGEKEPTVYLDVHFSSGEVRKIENKAWVEDIWKSYEIWLNGE